jgi:hypothetical protein
MACLLSTSPVNIEYSIHRYGEWTMLMLGEGVLQLIVVPVKPTATFYVTFALGYILMALLQLLHYATGPNHPDGHCMRRSARRVFFWVILESFYSASLVCVGVGLKLVLKYSTYEDLEKTQQYRSLLAAACSSAIMLVWGCRLCHAGLREEFYWPTGRMRFAKLVIWLVKIALASASLILVFVPVNSWVVEAGCAVCVFLSFGIQVYDSRRFGDSLRVRRGAPHRTVSDMERENTEPDGASGTSIDSATDTSTGGAPLPVTGQRICIAEDTDDKRDASNGLSGGSRNRNSLAASSRLDHLEVNGRASQDDDEDDDDDGYQGGGDYAEVEVERSRCELLRQHAWSTRDVMVCDGMGLPEHSSWVEVDLELVDRQIDNYQTQIKELKRLRRRHGAPAKESSPH